LAECDKIWFDGFSNGSPCPCCAPWKLNPQSASEFWGLGHAVLRIQEGKVKTRRRRDREAEEQQKKVALLSCIYLIVVAAISYVLAALAMAQVDLYRILGLRGSELPLIRARGEDIPTWVLQLALAVLIFLLLQPLTVIILGLFSRGKPEEEIVQLPPSPWEH
jgi:hypothetical protein